MGKRVGRRVPISDQRQGLTAQQSINFRRPALNLQHPARIHTGDRHGRRVTPGPRRLEIVMTRDPRCALGQELVAKQILLDQLRALAMDDPDFFLDIIEGETNLLELIGALDLVAPLLWDLLIPRL